MRRRKSKAFGIVYPVGKESSCVTETIKIRLFLHNAKAQFACTLNSRATGKKAPELFTSPHRSMHLRHQQVLTTNSSFTVVSKARKPTLRLITADVCASKRKGSSVLECLLREDSGILCNDCLCYGIRNASSQMCLHKHQE